MGKRKRGSNARRTAYEHDGFVEDLLPRDENGYVETGYSISFSDLMADIDDDDGDDADGVAAEEDEAPRGGPGSQVLPVAKHLPEDFDGNPTDGDEYLFLVRCALFYAASVSVVDLILQTRSRHASWYHIRSAILHISQFARRNFHRRRKIYHRTSTQTR